MLDLGTMEAFSVFDAMQKGLLDQETGLLLLEVQVITAGLMVPKASEKLSLAEGLTTDVINGKIYQHLEELQDAVELIKNMQLKGSPFHPVVAAIENGIISESAGLKIAQIQFLTGNFIDPSSHEQISLEDALQKGIITNHFHEKLVSCLKSCEALTDPNSVEKISFSDLMQQCVPHQETGLKLLPIKQVPGGVVSLQSGQEASILCAVHEGLVEKEVAMGLLEAHLFAGGLEDPKSGCQLTVEDAVRHNLIKQNLACDLLARQLQTGGIIDTVTRERFSLDRAMEGGLVKSRLAVMILESLHSFTGLVRPESGEIVPVMDSLEQGILTSELADKILRGRQNIKALFIAETNEIISWKKAVDCGILNKDLAKKLKSTCLPDFIPGMPLSGPSSSFQRRSSSSAQPVDHGEENQGPSRSGEQKMLLYLMTHSCVNIHNGEKLLLVEGELNSLSEILAPARENGSSTDLLEASKMQPQEWPEDVGRNATIEETGSCSEIILKKLNLSASENKQEQNLQPHICLPSKRIELEIGDINECVNVKEQEAEAALPGDLKSEMDEPRREQGWMMTQNKSRMEVQECKSNFETESGNKEVKWEEAKHEKQLPEEGKMTLEEQEREMGKRDVRKEVDLTADSLEKMEKFHIVVDNTVEKVTLAEVDRRPEATSWSSMGKVQNGSTDGLLNQAEGKPADGHVKRKQLAADKRAAPAYPSAGSALAKLSAEDSPLDALLTQLQEGGIVHEQTGKKMLLDEALACGAVSSHTAIKVMGEMKMFSGFFDAETSESLTTEEVIGAGLMDENLLQKVLASDQAISGIIDPWNKSIYSIKEASDFGLLDKETATRILEAQIVTGGIVDFKRGKKMSVTLASNLGLIHKSTQENLKKLEKAYKGKYAEDTIKEKLIALQAEIGGILDPKTKEPLTIIQAVKKGYLSEEKAFTLLTKQIANGGILHHNTGMRLCVEDALEHELINENLYQDLKKAEDICLHHSIYPEMNKIVSLPQAVSHGLISSDFQSKVQEIQASTGSIFDPVLGQKITLTEAVKKRLLSKAIVGQAAIASEMKEAILYPGSCRLVPYSEFVRRSKIDIASGHRYLEVIPFQDTRDEVTGNVLLISQAVKLGKVDPMLALRLLQAQADTSGVLETSTGQRLSLASAVEKEVLDEDTAKIIAINQILTGGIVSAESGKRVTLKEAVDKGLITPKLADAIKEADPITNKCDLEEPKGLAPQRLPQNAASKPKTLALRKYPNSEEPRKPSEATDSNASASAGLGSMKAGGKMAVDELIPPSPVSTAGSSFSQFSEENKLVPELAFTLDPVEDLRIKTQEKNSKKKNKLRKKELFKGELERQTRSNREAEKVLEGNFPVDTSTVNGGREQKEKALPLEESACVSLGLDTAHRTPCLGSAEGQAPKAQNKEEGDAHFQGSTKFMSKKQADSKLLGDAKMGLPSQDSELKAGELRTLKSLDSKNIKKKKAKKIKKQSAPSSSSSEATVARRAKMEPSPSSAESLQESPSGGVRSPLKEGEVTRQERQASRKEQQHVGAGENIADDGKVSIAQKGDASEKVSEQKERLCKNSVKDTTEEQILLKKKQKPFSSEEQVHKVMDYVESFGSPESKPEDLQNRKKLEDKLSPYSSVTSFVQEMVKEVPGEDESVGAKELPVSSEAEESWRESDIVGPEGQRLQDREFPESENDPSGELCMQQESEGIREVENVDDSSCMVENTEEKCQDASTSTKVGSLNLMAAHAYLVGLNRQLEYS